MAIRSSRRPPRARRAQAKRIGDPARGETGPGETAGPDFDETGFDLNEVRTVVDIVASDTTSMPSCADSLFDASTEAIPPVADLGAVIAPDIAEARTVLWDLDDDSHIPTVTDARPVPAYRATPRQRRRAPETHSLPRGANPLDIPFLEPLPERDARRDGRRASLMPRVQGMGTGVFQDVVRARG